MVFAWDKEQSFLSISSVNKRIFNAITNNIENCRISNRYICFCLDIKICFIVLA